jgi:hypothetical protein
MTDKILHDLQLFFRTRFQSAGVVEDISVMVFEDDFVLDVMPTTLHKHGSSLSATTDMYKPV